MPKITITTNESVSVGSVSATTTVVLLPIYLKSGEEMEVRYYGKNYSNNFNTDWSNRVLKCTADSKPDPSYIAAQLLINAGLNILVKPVNYPGSEGPRVDNYYNFISDLATDLNQQISEGLYNDFKSVNSYDISYVTSGAHHNLYMHENSIPGSQKITIEAEGCYSVLNGIAENRGDCLALIELFKCSPEDLTRVRDVVDTDLYKTYLLKVPSTQNGAIFYPWCSFGETYLPAGIAYLKAFANSLQTNPDWMAAAGVSRGLIPDCTGAIYNVSETLAEQFLSLDSGSCVNPIMNINNYGLRVWGNRTGFRDSTSFYAYLNIKVLVNILKKQIYRAASAVTFEPNDDITWVNFKSLVNTLLDKMVSGRGIRSYSWTRNSSNEKATINASLVITPIEAVENFVININLKESSDTGSTVVEIV